MQIVDIGIDIIKIQGSYQNGILNIEGYDYRLLAGFPYTKFIARLLL